MNTKQISKFLVSGGTAACVEYGVFLILHGGMHSNFLLFNQSFSFLCGFFVSFSLNKQWVFKSDGDTKGELVRYSLLAAINLFLSNLLIHGLVDGMHLPQWIAKFVVMAAVASWNYTIFVRIIFKKAEA